MIKVIITILFPIVYFSISWFFPWDKVMANVSISPSYLFDLIFIGATVFFFKSKLKIGKSSVKLFTIKLLLSFVFASLCIGVINLMGLVAPFKFVDKLFIQVLILAPIIEELIFREAFYTVFKRAGLPSIWQGLINSALFSLSHLPAIWILPAEFKSFVIFQLIYTFVLGWVCFKSREVSKGILEPILIHLVFNLVFYMAVSFQYI